MHRRGNPPGQSAAIAVKLSGKRTEARRKRRLIVTFLERLFFDAGDAIQNPNIYAGRIWQRSHMRSAVRRLGWA